MEYLPGLYTCNFSRVTTYNILGQPSPTHAARLYRAGHREGKAEVRLLPKGTSQFSLALDSFPFGVLGKEINKKASSKMVTDPNLTLNHMIRDLIPAAMETAFIGANIRDGFKETGTYPFNTETIKTNYRENLDRQSIEEKKGPLSVIEDIVKEQLSDIFKKDCTKKQQRKPKSKASIHLWAFSTS